MTETLTYPEAKVSETGPKLDWRLPVFLTVLNLVSFAIQYGTMQNKLEETIRRQDQEDRHMEYIDSELKAIGEETGEVKQFRRETERRFDSLDRKLERRQ